MFFFWGGGVSYFLKMFSFIWRCRHYRWRASKFDLYLALMAIKGEVSLACHIYCDTSHPFILLISEMRDTHTCCWTFSSGDSTICFHDLHLLRLGFEHPTFRIQVEHLNRLSHRLEEQNNSKLKTSYIGKIFLYPDMSYIKFLSGFYPIKKKFYSMLLDKTSYRRNVLLNDNYN